MTPEPTPDAAPSSHQSPAPESKPRRKRSLLRIIGMLLCILLVAMAMSVGGAEYYTSRPDFCGSCHIMDPYYETWTKDKHGAKLDVWCVECHYAPGEQHTLMAKFKGLSQLASYFSGRAGASRPRAHVNDDSCLLSKCHGDAEHVNKSLLIGEPRKEKRIIAGFETEVQRTPTVRFVHAKHLQVADRRKETDATMSEIASRLKGVMPAEAFTQVQAASRSIQPAADRDAAMTALMERLGLPNHAKDALELLRLEHIRLRLAQLEGINCSACHTFDAKGSNHFAVDQQTCFVCHFTNQQFNRDTAECLRCHEPPARKIAVHGITETHATPTGAATLMDHQDIIDRKIDCASCHFDVVSGSTTVTARDCASCHDQDRYLANFANRDTKIVEDYHRVHVAMQRARCPDCHRTIEHRLIDPQHVGMSSGFLQPVLQDCQHCHPNHHREQVDLLMGTGGHGVSIAMPNAMFGSRLNCRACHTQSGTDFKGDPLVKATENTCLACHGDDYRKLFDQWMSEIQASVKELEASVVRAEALEKDRRTAGRPLAADAVNKIEAARANLHFVQSGNGIHNKNFALQLIDVSQRDLDAVLTNAAD